MIPTLQPFRAIISRVRTVDHYTAFGLIGYPHGVEIGEKNTVIGFFAD